MTNVIIKFQYINYIDSGKDIMENTMVYNEKGEKGRKITQKTGKKD